MNHPPNEAATPARIADNFALTKKKSISIREKIKLEGERHFARWIETGADYHWRMSGIAASALRGMKR